MNHRLKGRKIIYGDIIDPDLTIAELSEKLTLTECEKFVSSLNNGHEMLLTFERYRNDLNIYSVVNLMEELKKSFIQWERDMIAAQRKERTELWEKNKWVIKY